jgi:deoxyribodipyrimidine photo-lyase
MRTVVWFRGKDLRIADHAPLAGARGGELVPLFVLDPYFFAPERARTYPHRAQFLVESLAELERAVAARGTRLLVVPGRSVDVVPRLARAWKADRVAAYRWVEPVGRERDRRVGEALAAAGIAFELHEGETLAPPGRLRTAAGGPYTVFTPFARAFAREIAVDPPLPAPRALPPLPRGVTAETSPVPSIEELGLLRNPRVLRGGERAARARLRAFLDGPAADYAGGRDRLDRAGTSRLSQDLKFGTLSAREVWRAAGEVMEGRALSSFRNELVWREFTHALLWEWPELLDEPFRDDFKQFPWRRDAAGWEAWASGRTGYPVVDASARQLLGEGFVHNRARMISASFLTKHLLIDYRRGEAHYLRWLTDGDWAQNNAGWQWSAGCGVDAQPWFRVFNPVLQGRRFDPGGDYVRRWVPELARLDARWIHAPWEAPAAALGAAGIELGRTYPRPIVEHAAARARYLTLAASRSRRPGRPGPRGRGPSR